MGINNFRWFIPFLKYKWIQCLPNKSIGNGYVHGGVGEVRRAYTNRIVIRVRNRYDVGEWNEKKTQKTSSANSYTLKVLNLGRTIVPSHRDLCGANKRNEKRNTSCVCMISFFFLLFSFLIHNVKMSGAKSFATITTRMMRVSQGEWEK